MMDREKVIKALENCNAPEKCRDCPWKPSDEFDCKHSDYPDGLIGQAIALLKAQESAVPIKRSAHAQGADDVWYECGKCGKFLGVNRYSKQFCPQVQKGGEVGMTIERIIELLEIEKECVLRNATGECNRYCARCELLQDDTELHEMYTESIALLKAQEPVEPLKMEVDHVRKEPVVFSYECPVCMCGLQRHWVACPICGTGVKWDA